MRLLDDLDPTEGEWFSGHGGLGVPNSWRMHFPPATIVARHPGRWVKRRWLNAQSIGDRVEPRSGWTLLEVSCANQRVLLANIADDGTIEVQLHTPGRWEEGLGLDRQNDTVPVSPNFFMDERDPFFQAWPADNPRPAH